MDDKYISISQLTRYIKYKIEQDVHLQEVFLRGEISNFKAHSRGHFYFTLKDEEARINAVMFASSATKVKFMPQDGMKVLISGKVSVYPANGGYQVYVNEMLEDGYSKVIVYEKDGIILGFISAVHLYDTCDIVDLIVDPKYRRKMVATNLIGYLISDLGENLKLITLEVAKHNEVAIKLYEKFGFEIVSLRKKYYKNDDAYLMARKC